MDKNEILNGLNEIITDIKGEVKFDINTPLIQSGLMDSLELINYLTQIEEKFNVSISMEELAEYELGIIGKMVDYIAGKI